MTIQTIGQIVAAVFAVIGAIWTATQIYSYWFVRRARLIGVVVHGIYAEHPRSGQSELLGLLHRLHNEQWGESLAREVRANGAATVDDVRNRIRRMTEGLGAPRLEPSLGDFFVIEIRNDGSTTLQSVRLLSSHGFDPIILRGGSNEFIEHSRRPSGGAVSVEIGALQPDDRVVLYAWLTPEMRLRASRLPSAKGFRLTHSDGRGQMVEKATSYLHGRF